MIYQTDKEFKQHPATYCKTQQHTAAHKNKLQHAATHCNTPQRTATHCNTLQHAYHKDEEEESIQVVKSVWPDDKTRKSSTNTCSTRTTSGKNGKGSLAENMEREKWPKIVLQTSVANIHRKNTRTHTHIHVHR